MRQCQTVREELATVEEREKQQVSMNVIKPNLNLIKEHDFSVAIQARDDAMRQCQSIREQLATVEEREKQQVIKSINT